MMFDRLKKRLYLPGDAWVLALSATIWNIGGAMVNPYQSIFFYAVGADALFIGYLLAMSSATTAVTQLLGGYIADAWGRRKVVAVFSFISAVSAFIYIFIEAAVLLIIPIMLVSIAGLYGPAINAMLTESMEQERRARGVASFTLVTSLPSVFSPYIGGLFMSMFGTLQGLRLAFFMSGLFGVVGITHRALRLKETYSGSVMKKRTTLSEFLSDFVKSMSFVFKNASQGARRLLVYSVMASAGTAMTVPYTSLYLVGALGLPPAFYGILTNLAGLISVLLLLPAARIIEKVGLRKSAIYASLSVPANQLIFVRAKGTDDFVAWSAIGGASASLLGPSLTALQADLSPQETRGRFMALFSVFSLVPAIPAQIIGGYLYGSWGVLTPFLFSIPLFAFATITLTRIREPAISQD